MRRVDGLSRPNSHSHHYPRNYQLGENPGNWARLKLFNKYKHDFKKKKQAS
jgi:hypothetical protein